MSGDKAQGDQERDPRPRPEYGELAPEGWAWKPTQGNDSPAMNPPAHTPANSSPNPSPRVPPNGSLGRTTSSVPGWDRPLTLGLLMLGLLATFFIVSVLSALPDALQALYTQEGLGTYTPDPTVAGLITAGGITEAVTWLVTASISILLMVRGRRAFYLPLIGGVVSFVVIFVFTTVVLATDSTLLDFYSRP